MKHTLLILLAFIAFIPETLGQSARTYNDSSFYNVKKELTYNRDSAVFCEIYTVKGKKILKRQFLNLKTKSIEVCDYRNGVPHGAYYKWNALDSISERGMYAKGKKTGKWTYELLRDDITMFDSISKDGYAIYRKTTYSDSLMLYSFGDLDVQSEFIGGWTKWNDFIRSDLIYPEEAWEQKLEGNVLVQIIVLKTGHLASARVINTNEVAPILARAALDFVFMKLIWKPGQVKGEKVHSIQLREIAFRLDAATRYSDRIVIIENGRIAY